ncbi:MAG: hypothetical protein FOGNACKC_04828 [Anaerolineae bacterium]|nr:hypothetical protein [Anaerolineae bacterium]
MLWLRKECGKTRSQFEALAGQRMRWLEEEIRLARPGIVMRPANEQIPWPHRHREKYIRRRGRLCGGWWGLNQVKWGRPAPAIILSKETTRFQ